MPENDPSPKTWSYINWETLWTDSPPPIEVGPYRIRPHDAPAPTEELWSGFESLQVDSD